MFIRSQDKKSLVKAEKISIKQSATVEQFLQDFMDDKNSTFKIADFGTVTMVLGEYATRERAIEVLDQIREQLITNSTHDKIINGRKIIGETVFEMPEE